MPVGPGTVGCTGTCRHGSTATAIVSEDPAAPGGPPVTATRTTAGRPARCTRSDARKVPVTHRKVLASGRGPSRIRSWSPSPSPPSASLLRPFEPARHRRGVRTPARTRTSSAGPRSPRRTHASTRGASSGRWCPTAGATTRCTTSASSLPRRAGGLAAAWSASTQLRSPERQAELGFWTAKEHRGNGYTRRPRAPSPHWAFTELGVDRLEWLAEVGNEGSRAVARTARLRDGGRTARRIAEQGHPPGRLDRRAAPLRLGLPTADAVPARRRRQRAAADQQLAR